MEKHYHFIGIGGIGMSGLARLLLSRSISVSGSDIAHHATIENLIKAGAVIYRGHAAEHVKKSYAVVYSTDIKPDNPEYQAALAYHCPLLHRSDLLAQLLEERQALAVTGTHGKTTTSSLLATVLIEANEEPSFAIGGILHALKSNAHHGLGKTFVFEADESDGSFLKYHPFGAIVTNIGRDHLSHFGGSESQLIEAFKTFMSQVRSSSHLFWCRDNPPLAALNVSGQTYGVHPESDWRITRIEQKGFTSVFDLTHHGKKYLDIELGLIGNHNVLNATAVFGLTLTLGIPEASIRRALAHFKGVGRRCEVKGKWNDILFLDDYAHHPTEIETTLKGIRRAIGEKRLVVVFQPHRYTRTQECLGSYGNLFEEADHLVLTDIFGAGETPIPDVTADKIFKEIQQASSVCCQYVARPALRHHLSQFLQPHDVMVTLGAGDVTLVGPETMISLEHAQ